MENINELIDKLKQDFISRNFPENFLEIKSRKREYVWCRHVFYYILRNKYGVSPTILERHGVADRCNIIHSVKFVNNMKYSKDFEFLKFFNWIDL